MSDKRDERVAELNAQATQDASSEEQEQARLRSDARSRLQLRWDDEHAEAVLFWDDNPIVMVRSQSFGVELYAAAEFIDGLKWEKEHHMALFPPAGRFTLHSWDNESTEGDFTDALHGSTLTWEGRIQKEGA
jgi:hypothetical protein